MSQDFFGWLNDTMISCIWSFLEIFDLSKTQCHIKWIKDLSISTFLVQIDFITYLCESLLAAFVLAFVRFLFIMHSLMLLHGRVLSKSALANRTILFIKNGVINCIIKLLTCWKEVFRNLPHIWALTGVSSFMLFKDFLARE